MLWKYKGAENGNTQVKQPTVSQNCMYICTLLEKNYLVTFKLKQKVNKCTSQVLRDQAEIMLQNYMPGSNS